MYICHSMSKESENSFQESLLPFSWCLRKVMRHFPGLQASRQFCFCRLSCCRGDEITDVSPDSQCFYVGSRHRSDSGLSAWCPLSRLPSLSGF